MPFRFNSLDKCHHVICRSQTALPRGSSPERRTLPLMQSTQGQHLAPVMFRILGHANTGFDETLRTKLHRHCPNSNTSVEKDGQGVRGSNTTQRKAPEVQASHVVRARQSRRRRRTGRVAERGDRCLRRLSTQNGPNKRGDGLQRRGPSFATSSNWHRY